MTRENLLFSIIGLLLGFIIGFMFASTMSQRLGPGPSAATAGTQNLPADHPPLDQGGSANPQGMQAEVAASLEKARKEPNNFEAQIKAAELYYQIQRFDTAVLAGLCAATLGEGNAKAAEEAIAKLEKVDSSSQDLPQFRERLASLKAGDKGK